MTRERRTPFHTDTPVVAQSLDRELTAPELWSRTGAVIMRGRQILKKRGEVVIVEGVGERPFPRVQTPVEMVDFGERGVCPVWLQRSSKTPSSWQLATKVDEKEVVLYKSQRKAIKDGARNLVTSQLSFANLEKLLDLIS